MHQKLRHGSVCWGGMAQETYDKNYECHRSCSKSHFPCRDKKKQKQKQIHLLNLLNANALNFDKAKPPISEYRNAFV